MRERSLLAWRRGHCRLGLSRGAVSVLRMDKGRLGTANKPAPRVAERLLSGLATAAPDELAAHIGAALEEAGGGGLPVYATFGDDLVRYFIVTPPANGARMQDLRAAAGARFQMLYGESASAWQLAADWQAATPFLACAVSQRLHTALQLAVDTQRGCLVCVAPNFVAAWNRWRRRLAADAWLATLHGRTLTLGLVAGAARQQRIAAVRMLTLPEDAPPLDWLREQVARAALLDNVTAPSVLHVHGPQVAAWQHAGAAPGATGMAVRWCTAGNLAPASAATAAGSGLSAVAQLAWGGAAP